MNLIHDPWIPVRTQGGGAHRIALLQIGDPEINEITSPRPDFTSALYQLCIGLLQLCLPPEDLQEWSQQYMSPPSTAKLEGAFSTWQDAFELDDERGPAFMQDLDPLAAADPVDIARLLIDTPGEKTISDNNDLFLHAGSVRRMCPGCAAAAVLTLQINAPAGGAGHRVSLRGGGPLTSLRMPRDSRATLFQKLWSNILPPEQIDPRAPRTRAEVMPWLGPTRTSDAKGSGDTTPLEAHPLQAYWSMPRRVRLDWKTAERGECDLCGGTFERCVRQYRTRPYGTNYTGAWRHPLTPYNLDPKQEKPPISLKGQRGGIGYRHWLGLVLGEREGSARPATVVNFFNSQRHLPEQARHARLWCFGYDLDNMKARCWYDATLPLPTVDPDHIPYLTETVKQVLDCANELASIVRKQAGAAVHPNGEGDPAVSQNFWQVTETDFYRFLQRAMDSIADRQGVAVATQEWLQRARSRALQVFDSFVLSVPIQEGDMERVVAGRAGLQRALYGGKSKALWNSTVRQKEATA